MSGADTPRAGVAALGEDFAESLPTEMVAGRYELATEARVGMATVPNAFARKQLAEIDAWVAEHHRVASAVTYSPSP